jgi:hypothetical protein
MTAWEGTVDWVCGAAMAGARTGTKRRSARENFFMASAEMVMEMSLM